MSSVKLTPGFATNMSDKSMIIVHTAKKCFSSLVHLQIMERPERVESRGKAKLTTLPKKVTPQF